MAHPLVLQLRFTRSEFKRSVAGIPEEDARKRVMPMNCISWTVGHLAWQEQRYFLVYPGSVPLVPTSTPVLADMWSAWDRITRAADRWLDALTTERLQYHTGENMAVRKILGHTGLGVFVGDIDHEAPYTPGSDG